MSATLTAGSFTPSVLLEAARRSGRLAGQDLEVREVAVPSSPAQFRSLLAGDLDVAFTSPDNVLAYRFSPSNPLGSTADVQIVATVDRGLGLGLYGRPGLTGDDLRGAAVGVDVPHSGFALALYALAEHLGVARGEYQVVALGSTPQRLAALLDGRCDATMLNAGNELVAEDAGCPLLGRVSVVCAPYLGTVLAVAGRERLVDVRRLAQALRTTAGSVVSGELDPLVTDVARDVLGLSEASAVRYLDRLKDPSDGLIAEDSRELPALRTIVSLRQRFLPEIVDGVDVLERALEPESRLFAESTDR